MSFSKRPSKICINEVKDNDPAVLCNLCEKWVHAACIGIEETQYENLKKIPCHGTARIALQSFPSLQSIIKTFIALLFPVVPQTLIKSFAK